MHGEIFARVYFALFKLYNHRLGIKLGFSMPYDSIGYELALVHYPGQWTYQNRENCCIHHEVTIGATSGSSNAAMIADNCFIRTGAVLPGRITIADNAIIEVNAIVTKSITEPGTTWTGVPTRKISNNNSYRHLSPLLKLD